jgi:hypothetical protein
MLLPNQTTWSEDKENTMTPFMPSMIVLSWPNFLFCGRDGEPYLIRYLFMGQNLSWFLTNALSRNVEATTLTDFLPACRFRALSAE